MTINKLEEIIKQKASTRLLNKIKEMKFSEVDLMNTHVELPVGVEYTCGKHDGPDRDGKRFVRCDKLIPLIKDAIFKKYINEFEESERNNFMTDLNALREYLNT